MNDWLGVLLSLLVIFVRLALAWWWVVGGESAQGGLRRHPLVAWEDAPMNPGAPDPVLTSVRRPRADAR